jgi:hypothetical protein
VGRYSPSPVTMSSPHPLEECMRRLAKATAPLGSAWYLDPRTALLPDPLLSGYVGKWSIQVTDFADPGPRYGGHPLRLEAELKPAPDGGTTLQGQVSPMYSAKVSAVTRTAVGAVIPFVLLGVFITGLVLLSRGYIASAMPDLLIPLPFGVLLWLAVKAGRRTPDNAWDEARARLLWKVTRLIDATVDVPDAAGSP